ncbi:MAG: FAD:protein FMN transferase [Patescibacteria group bacterium]
MPSQTFKAIGTTWQIDIKDTESTPDTSSIFSAIRGRIELFESQYSRFRKDSLVTQISDEAGIYQFPPDGKILFGMYRKLYDLSDGKVTPLIGQTLVDTGYDPEYSLTPKEIIQPTLLWDNVMKYDDETNTLTTFVPIQLDFGALGKGYIVDVVSEMIMAAGIQDFTVDAGGDMHHRGEAIRVGLEHPENPEQAIGIAEILNCSICGSSGNRRAWNKYHHIINPETQESPRDIIAIWVVADSTMLADGLTTALFFTDPEKLKGSVSFEYILVRADGSAFISPNFPGSLF